MGSRHEFTFKRLRIFFYGGGGGVIKLRTFFHTSGEKWKDSIEHLKNRVSVVSQLR